jgi:hypothetical protein
VLWRLETTSGNGVIDERPWQLVQAAPSYGASGAAQAKTIKNIASFWAKAGRDVSSATEDTVLISIKDAEGKQIGLVTLQFRCLPDTVDPRGPKGK